MKKVVLHELGHNFGIPHCTKTEPCVMKDAVEKISTVDNAHIRNMLRLRKINKVEHKQQFCVYSNSME